MHHPTMHHRAVILTAAAVLSTAGIPATIAADSSAPPAPALLTAATLPATTLLAPGTSSALPVQGPPPIHALTAASGAPAIAARTPKRAATGVSRTINVKVRFTRAVRASSIVIRLRNPLTGAYVAGKLTYASSTWTATFNPTPVLGPLTTYRVIVSGAKSLAGVTMAKTSWTFTTRP